MNCNYLIKTGVVLFTILSVNLFAQNVGINSKGNKPSSDAVLDLRTGNLGSALGFLPNEVALSATNSSSPFSTVDTGLIVYNYKTTGTAPYNVVPGYYYWTGSAWVMMLAPGAGTNGYILSSNGGGAPSWVSPSSGLGAVRYVGTSYLGLTSGTGSTGTSEGTGSNLYNINIGDSAGNTNYNGNQNVAIGDQALLSNDKMSGAVAIGSGAMSAATYSQYYPDGEVAIGYQALNNTVSNGGNTAIGYQSQNTGSPSSSTSVGYRALYNNDAYRNSALGYEALKLVNDGIENTAVGYHAGYTNGHGYDNTFIGTSADATSSSLSNSTAIGYNASVSTNNTMVFGNNSVTATEFNGALMPYYSSTYNAGTTGQVLTSEGSGVAPQWVNPTTYTAGSGIKISNDTISSTQSTGAINYVGDSYLGITSGAGSTGTSEGTSSNLVNIYIGKNAGNANTTGNNNFFLGNQAGYNNTSGNNNVAIGSLALQLNDRISDVIAIGTNSLANINYYSYALNTGGDIAIGVNALAAANSNKNTAIGFDASHFISGVDGYNTVVGYEVMGASTQGSYNSAFGYKALDTTTGSNNSGFGYNSGITNVAGSNNTFLGYKADAASSGLSNATAIGANATVSTSNTVLLGSNSVTATEFNGALMPYYSSAYQAGNSGQILESQGSGVAPQWVSASSGLGAIRYIGTSYLGITSGAGSTGTSEGTSSNLVNINIGQNAGNANTTGSNNFFLGNQAGYNNTTGSNNVAIGTQTLLYNDKIPNLVAIGTNALSSVSYDPNALNSGGDIAIGVNALAGAYSNKNTAVGFGAGHFFGNTDSNNTLIGYEVQGGTVVAGINNSGLGYHSLFNSTGSRNSAFGSSSGFSNVAGSNNTFLGYKADAASSGLTNATAIGANATVSTSNSLILGSGANVGIGTSSPTSILHTIASGAKTTAYSGNLFTNAATSSTSSITKSGVEIQSTGSWTGSSANNIGLYVSSVTGGTANYDAIFNGGGNVGIGTTSPSSPLEVVGTAQYISQFQSSNTTGTWMVLNNTTTGGIPWNFVATGSANGEGAGNLLIRDNSNVRMIMQSSTGNIGIGTASPTAILHTVASGAKTAAYSGNLLTNTATSSTSSIKKAGVEIQSTGSWTGSSASNIGLYVSSVTGGTSNYDAIFNGGGNVGIGTTSPTAVLHTVASGAKTAAYSGNLLTNTATSSTASITKAGLEIQSTGTWSGTSANNIGLYVSSTTGGTNNYDAIFNGGGNVGIGTSSPTTLFYVTGTTSSGGYIATVANTTNAGNSPSVKRQLNSYSDF